MEHSFSERIAARVERVGSLVCVGLDPDLERLPEEYRHLPPDQALRSFCIETIDATADAAACFKPNAAFFEAHGPAAVSALHDVVLHARRVAPVILDAKRGDIGNTARAYAQAAFEGLGADAVTVNPYLGEDGVTPFLERPDRGAFVLCRTSNPGSADFQEVPDANGTPLWERVAEKAREWNEGRGNVGLVVGATSPDALARARRIAGDGMWFLVPGVGAQGGSAAATVQKGGARVLVNASRSILFAGDGSPEAQARACHELRDELNAHRAGVTA